MISYNKDFDEMKKRIQQKNEDFKQIFQKQQQSSLGMIDKKISKTKSEGICCTQCGSKKPCRKCTVSSALSNKISDNNLD